MPDRPTVGDSGAESPPPFFFFFAQLLFIPRVTTEHLLPVRAGEGRLGQVWALPACKSRGGPGHGQKAKAKGQRVRR